MLFGLIGQYISFPETYSFWSILSDDNADIFANLLISYCNFTSLILSLIFLIRFNILSKRSFLKQKGLFDAIVLSDTIVLFTKKEYGFGVHKVFKIHKVFKVNIWWMIKCDFLKLSFVWNFHDKKMCWV